MLQLGSEYDHICLYHDKGQKRMSWSKLEPLINVCCKVMVNVWSHLQECTVRNKVHLKDVIFKNKKHILMQFYYCYAIFFLYSTWFVKTAIKSSSHSTAYPVLIQTYSVSLIRNILTRTLYKIIYSTDINALIIPTMYYDVLQKLKLHTKFMFFKPCIVIYIQSVPGGMCQTSGECSLY
jgi:hypothetical protein